MIYNTDNPLVNILILNWNGWKDTIECLESVFQLQYPNYRVIVIDNGSSNDSVNKIKKWADGGIIVNSKHVVYDRKNKPIPYVGYDKSVSEEGGLIEIERQRVLGTPFRHPLIILETGRNLGFSGGNNVALKYVLANNTRSYIWLLNNDTVVKSASLLEMVKVSENTSSVGMVGSKVYFYSDPENIQIYGGKYIINNIGLIGFDKLASKYFAKKDKGNRDPDYICGASLLIHIDVIRRIGLLDEDYFFYGEDADWCSKARKIGLKNIYCEKSEIFHKGGSSIGGESPESDYHLTKGKLLYIYKNSMVLGFVKMLACLGIILCFRIMNNAENVRLAHVTAIIRAFRDVIMETVLRKMCKPSTKH